MQGELWLNSFVHSVVFVLWCNWPKTVPDVDKLWDAVNFLFKDFWEFCTVRTWVWFHGCHLYIERDVCMDRHGEGGWVPCRGHCLGMSGKNRGRAEIPNSGALTWSRRPRQVWFGNGTGRPPPSPPLAPPNRLRTLVWWVVPVPVQESCLAWMPGSLPPCLPLVGCVLGAVLFFCVFWFGFLFISI